MTIHFYVNYNENYFQKSRKGPPNFLMKTNAILFPVPVSGDRPVVLLQGPGKMVTCLIF